MVVAALMTMVLSSPAYVQSTCAAAGEATFTQPVAAGDLIVAAFEIGTGDQIGSVTDTLGNSYSFATEATVYGGGSGHGELWYAVSKAAGADTVTANFSAGGTPGGTFIHEYSGVSIFERAAMDVDAGAQGSAGPFPVSGGSELIVAFSQFPAGSVTAAVNGFSSRQTCNSDMSADGIFASAGVYAPTFDYSANSGWLVVAAEFAATLPPDAGAGGSDGGGGAPGDAGLHVGCGCHSGGDGGALIPCVTFGLLLAVGAMRGRRRPGSVQRPFAQ